LVKVELNNNNLKLTGQDNEYATSAEEYLICDYSNNPISIGFSCQFLLEIANILEDDNLTIELADPSRPGVLRPANDDPQDEILMLLMPMRVED
jgi:DNA polymerase-3 subunit beta